MVSADFDLNPTHSPQILPVHMKQLLRKASHSYVAIQQHPLQSALKIIPALLTLIYVML